MEFIGKIKTSYSYKVLREVGTTFPKIWDYMFKIELLITF